MSGLTKKPVKSKSRKPAKRVAEPTDVSATPVLFRLPDLTLLPEYVSAANSSHLEFASETHLIGASVPAGNLPEPAASPAKGSSGTNPLVARKSLLMVRHFLSTSARGTERVVRRVIRLPYVAPTGLLCASLLIALGVIYYPSNGNKQTASVDQVSPPHSHNEPLNVGHSDEHSTKSPHSQKTDVAVESKNMRLKKIASQLDEQLVEQEPTDANEAVTPDVSIAAATEADLAPADEELEAESFTEPWSRKKPAKDVKVARADVERDDQWTRDDQEGDRMEEEEAPPKRTAMRQRDEEESFDEEMEAEAPAPKRNRSSRFADDDYLMDKADGSRNAPEADEAIEESGDEEEAPSNPWHRIRNERLQREPNHREKRMPRIVEPPPSKKQSSAAEANPRQPNPKQANQKQAQYRSPPGQDIDLERELLEETASRPRSEPKRNSPR